MVAVIVVGGGLLEDRRPGAAEGRGQAGGVEDGPRPTPCAYHSLSVHSFSQSDQFCPLALSVR